jgi:hypothetical protein
MEDKIVKNIEGFEVPESTCRLVDGQYYSIGDVSKENSGQIYLINKRYIRPENLVFNHTVGKYTLPNANLIEGIVRFEENKLITGLFESNPLYNIILIDKDNNYHVCLNKSIISLDYREEKSTGIFYHISIKKAKLFNLIKDVSKEYKESFPYDSRGITDKFTKKFNANYKPNITKSVKTYAPLLKKYTFGLEFETVKGILNENILKVLPLIPLRDGSISGLEYVTIPLSGEIGLQALIDSAYHLESKTEYNTSCALHYHVGNIPRTPEFLLAFWKVASFFQDEMFSMFPLYKKYNFGVKRKNYSKPFPINKVNSLLDASIDIKNKEQVNKNFDVIFSYLSEGTPFAAYNNNLDNVKEHPRDPSGNQKWNINTRYYANNLVPIIFGNKQTIEFRIHTPTYDIDKIINFLLINIYILDYTVNNTELILKDFSNVTKLDNLRNFIDEYLRNEKILKKSEKNNLLNYHISYINTRVRRLEEINSRGKIEGDEDLIHCNKVIRWNHIDTKDNTKSLSNFNDFNDSYRPNRNTREPMRYSVPKSFTTNSSFNMATSKLVTDDEFSGVRLSSSKQPSKNSALKQKAESKFDSDAELEKLFVNELKTSQDASLARLKQQLE